jgi:hypothetical protein
MNESINDKAVYRTATATPGLLNTLCILLAKQLENTLGLKMPCTCELVNFL